MNATKLTQYLDSLQDVYGMPMGDLKVMQHHAEVYRHAFGYADHKRHIPVQQSHLFRLYSATKLITMTAMLQLIEKGKCHLNDRLDMYLPAYEKVNVQTHPAKNPIRIIDLMTMTAGFSYDTNDPNIRKAVQESGGEATTQEIITALAKTPLLFEPGTHWNYSLSHDVLAAVVEKISGMRFSDYLNEQIFGPLGIRDFYFRWENNKEVADRICDIYTATEEHPPFVAATAAERDTYCFTKNYESGGAGLIASVDAYSIFADALACGGVGANGNRILKRETVSLFRKPYTTQGQIQQDFGLFNRIGYEYGLGVRVLVDGSKAKSSVGEFGWDGAAGAYVLVDMDREISVFYAEHVLGFSDNYHVIHPKIRDLVYEMMEE